MFDRFRVLGLAGSLALAVGGCAAGALPVADPFARVEIIRQLREIPAVALVIAYGGLALLVVAWLFLGRLVGTPRGPDHRSLILTLAVWAAPLCVAPPMFSKDVYSYAAQGWLVAQHANPYFWGPAAIPGPFTDDVGAMWRHTASPYGPVFLRVASWLVPAQHVVMAVVLLRLLAVLGLGLIAWGLMRLARDPAQALWLAVAVALVVQRREIFCRREARLQRDHLARVRRRRRLVSELRR